MRRLAVVIVLLALPAVAGAKVFDSATLKAGGLGPLRTGMTVAEVEAVIDRNVNVRVFPGSTCGTARLDGRNSMLFTDGVLRRITLASGNYLSKGGLGVGTDEVNIRTAFGERAKRSQHAYDEDGSYYDVRFGAKLLRFETDGERITQIHGGRVPEVRYVEGCS